MTNRAKQKGTSYETSLVPILSKYYPGTERRTLSGANDKGDINAPGSDIVWECKNHKSMSLGAWVDEAVIEANNANAKVGVVVHKRRGTAKAEEQFVTLRLGDFLELINGSNKGN